MLLTRNTSKHTNRLKVKGTDKMFCANRVQKKEGTALTIQHKIDHKLNKRHMT